MNPHIKLVAILHIVMGALGLMGALIAFSMFGIVGGLATWEGDTQAATIIGIFGLCVGGFIALLSVPGIIGGWALLAQKSWARVLMIVLGSLNLLNFPLGTALGIYTLWALLRDEQGQHLSTAAPCLNPTA